MKARTEGRRVGKTMHMVRTLPKHRSLVLVHTPHMKGYIEQMVRDVRPDLTINRDVYVRVIQHERDVNWLRGLSDREVRVDHYVWEALAPRTCDLLRIQLRTMAGRGGLGVVNATIERGPNGDITAVVLPGHGWE